MGQDVRSWIGETLPSTNFKYMGYNDNILLYDDPKRGQQPFYNSISVFGGAVHEKQPGPQGEAVTVRRFEPEQVVAQCVDTSASEGVDLFKFGQEQENLMRIVKEEVKRGFDYVWAKRDSTVIEGLMGLTSDETWHRGSMQSNYETGPERICAAAREAMSPLVSPDAAPSRGRGR